MSVPAGVRAAVSAREALDGASTAIGAGGSSTPRLDAELLLCSVLQVPRERLHSRPELPVAGGAVRAYQALVRRRSIEREPIAYILGRQGFRRLELTVDRRALIPRPESELLVEVAVELVASGGSVLDLGTGSGALALAIADERPDLRVQASDVSQDALALARSNAARLGLEKIDFLLAAGVPDGGSWDAIVANPPYIPSAELAGLVVSRHEPQIALDGGADGLSTIREILAAARSPLLALEVGAGQAPAVRELMLRGGYTAARTRRDLAGIERVVIGSR